MIPIEGTDEIQLTVDDILSETAETEEPRFHSILEVWREIIRPAEMEQHKRITPQWANRITSSYRELNFADMPHFQQHYFKKVLALLDRLRQEIDDDPECLNVTSAQEDVERNGQHYFDVILEWEVEFLKWELDWDCTELHAAIELAAISEVHRMFFSDTGLLSLLDQINYTLTDERQEAMVQALAAAREVYEEGR